MRRFFVDKEMLQNTEVLLDGELEHYLRDVLRLKNDSLIELSDGENELCVVRLCDFSQGIRGEIIERQVFFAANKVEIYLYQGLPKGDKLDFIVQKCTELGINGITPVEMPRSVVRLAPDKAHKKTVRLQKIAQEAAQQSKQDIVPEINEPLSWREFLQEIEQNEGINLLLWEDEQNVGLKEILENNADIGQINLIIGPEGGLGSEEVAALKNLGVVSVSLGKKILRTETASVAAIAMILYHYGDLGCV